MFSYTIASGRIGRQTKLVGEMENTSVTVNCDLDTFTTITMYCP